MRFSASHNQFSYHNVWRARLIGSSLIMPVYLAFYLADLLPLRGAQLLVFPALLGVYLAALRVRDGRSAVVWPLHLCEGVALALFVRETGGREARFRRSPTPGCSARRSRCCTTARAPPSCRC